MIFETAQGVLEEAKSQDGYISVFNFKPLYELGDYLVEGKTPLREILQGARMLMIDIKIPLQDINNLLRECAVPT